MNKKIENKKVREPDGYQRWEERRNARQRNGGTLGR
jgi:hypothetical protein